jgi:hypothetical protein
MRALGASRTSLVPGGVLAGPWVRDDLWRRARAVPSIDLRFADNKSLTDAVTGASLVTFTRASSGTFVDSAGVLQTAATDVPRFDHNPTTGESLGLLVEEERTNSFAWSNSATQGETWNNVGTQLNLASGQSDPAGGTAGIRATDANSVSAGTTLQRTSLANLTASTTISYSVWLKPIDCPNDVIRLNVFANTTTDAINAAFSVSGTAITAVTTSADGTGAVSGASFEVFPNGWYRCQLTGVPSTVTMADVRARVNLGSYQRAAGTDRFDWYGAQFESDAFATSYIPTSGIAATRNADLASITGSAFSSWYRQDEGTVFADCKVILDNGSNQFIYSISDGAIGDEIRLFKGSGNSSITNGIEDSVGGTTSNIFGNTNSPFGQSFKTAHAFANNYASRAVGGLASEVDNSVTVPAVNQIRIGARMNGTFYSNFYLSRLTYWPQRLANSTLQQITQ